MERVEVLEGGLEVTIEAAEYDSGRKSVSTDLEKIE
jgi:hypothetical protein